MYNLTIVLKSGSLGQFLLASHGIEVAEKYISLCFSINNYYCYNNIKYCLLHFKWLYLKIFANVAHSSLMVFEGWTIKRAFMFLRYLDIKITAVAVRTVTIIRVKQ